ncbi:hypothetical protein [Actinoallomurus acaciae]|uniref:MFS transporter n=1 Tax=Actinoallomurus acaciae TaxID=502577 RepID=A0ABV5Z063_9ACTN
MGRTPPVSPTLLRLASFTGPWMVARYGARRVVTFGCLLQFAGGVLLFLTLWHYRPHVNGRGWAPA